MIFGIASTRKRQKNETDNQNIHRAVCHGRPGYVCISYLARDMGAERRFYRGFLMQKQLTLKEFGDLVIRKNNQEKSRKKSIIQCPFCYSIVFKQEYCPNCGKELEG